MRSLASRYQIRFLSRASTVALATVLVAGCSTDFKRFTNIYDEGVPKSAVASNPYPDNVDPTTTASVNRRVVPLGEVSQASSPSAAYHEDEPTYAKPKYAYEAPATNNYAAPSTPSVPAAAAYSAPVAVKKTSLPKIVPSTDSYSVPDPVITSSVDKPSAHKVVEQVARETTASVEPKYTPPAPQNLAEVPKSNGGWSKVGGSAITLGAGETLYNISKRYGVPVNEIMAANAIANANQTQAGQRLIIPTYVYSDSAPVSAPDNNPKTLAARASSGMKGEYSNASTPVPTSKPYQTAALSSAEGVAKDQVRRTRRKLQAAPPGKDYKAPDYSIVTGSVKPQKNSITDGNYTIKSGDSLGKIAGLTGVSVGALKAANGLTGSNIRVGQLLKIPAVGQMVAPQVAKVDPVITKGIATKKKATQIVNTTKNVLKVPQASDKQSLKAPSTKDTVIAAVTGDAKTKAPKATGISSFRWPVNGRVITKFGENDNGSANDGIDISVPEGTAVKATENGKVVYVGDEISTYGNLVLIRHADDWVSAYAHNKSFNVKKGDQVRRGQTIARAGRTGDAAKPKLHFELRKNSNPVNPLNHLGS